MTRALLATLALLITATPAHVGKRKGMLTEHRKLELQSARSKGYTAYASAGATAVFGIGSMATNGSGAAPTMLGAASLLSTAITLPVGASGGNQARRLAASAGVAVPNRTLQTVAWVGYGVTVVQGFALVTYGAMDGYVPTGLIGSTALCGTMSTLGMAMDAVNTANVVESELRKGKKKGGGGRSGGRASVAPALSVSRERVTWGITGTF